MEKLNIDSSSQAIIKKILAALAGIIIGAAVAMYPPVQGLDESAIRALGVLSWAISWWILSLTLHTSRLTPHQLAAYIADMIK